MLDALLARFPDDARLLAVQAELLLREARPETLDEVVRVLERVVQPPPGCAARHFPCSVIL